MAGRVPYAEHSLGELLAAMAEPIPAPGGGAGVAWSAAMAAALVEMGARYAEGERMAEVAARAASLREQTLALADMDAEAYGAYLSAPPERRPAALSAAADPPLLLARAAAEVADLAAEVATDGKKGLRGDAITGAVLAEAACWAATCLVAINLEGDPSDPRLAEAQRWADAAASARERAAGSGA